MSAECLRGALLNINTESTVSKRPVLYSRGGPHATITRQARLRRGPCCARRWSRRRAPPTCRCRRSSTPRPPHLPAPGAIRRRQ